ncbi:hypothetical protein MFIFM68171_05612 [Madurella fahalii]|uniref:Uncharacterized protein n=1 Tax=Madurella fahalii TaxID=1157608 RepID=A0ABQ0GCD7_9PEZI
MPARCAARIPAKGGLSVLIDFNQPIKPAQGPEMKPHPNAFVITGADALTCYHTVPQPSSIGSCAVGPSSP